MKKKGSLLVLGALFTLSACSETLDDVSSRADYKLVIGTSYEVIGKLEAYGIGRKPHQRIDYVKLMPVYGYTGSEVGFNVQVQRGSRITVTHVYHTNRWFDNGITFGVRLEGTSLPVDAPVRLDLRDDVKGKEHVNLNPAIFKKI
jgi:hypothetical protein